MDKQHTCTNKCLFCFVDQMPKGLRESLYFKDDDERLSFLFGNYITMTNMKQEEVDRIIKMHITPINISVHSTDPELRQKLMGNRFAGKILDYLKQLDDAKIKVNCQIVLCKNLNDGENLRKTITDLLNFKNSVQSLAVVPVGLTKFRDGLSELEGFDENSANNTIDLIHEFSDEMLKQRETRVVYPADEFFLLANRSLPSTEYYEDFYQLDNGVGMLRLLEKEFLEELKHSESPKTMQYADIVTGEASYPMIESLVKTASEKLENISVTVHKIKNNFFGGNVTVAGLVTGTDIVEQLKNKNLKKTMIIPSVMLKYGENQFLDGKLVSEVEIELGVTLRVVDTAGETLLKTIIGE